MFARTDEVPVRTGLFVVPARSPGIHIEPSWDQLGLRGSGSDDVVFDRVCIPADHAVDLRAPSEWNARDPVGAAWAALMVGALYTGVAEAARDWTVKFLRGRVPANLGSPLATLLRMREAVGRMEASLLTNRRLIAAAAPPKRMPGRPGHGGKRLAEDGGGRERHCGRAGGDGMTGNHGLSQADPLKRHLRDVLCARMHTPQPDSAYTTVGRAALGQ